MNSTSKLVVENVESINYLRQKEQIANTKSLSDTFLPKIEPDQISETDSSYTSSVATTSITEKVDSIKSCESVLKIFTFENKGFNQRNEKCLEFWNLIESHPEIQPVNCTIMDAQKNKRDIACQTEQEESQESLWVRALHILKEKHLDKVAMATAQNNCKYCKPIKSNDIESSDSDHLSELDEFNPPCLNMLGKPLETISSESDQSLLKHKKSKLDPEPKPVLIEIPKKNLISTISDTSPEIKTPPVSEIEESTMIQNILPPLNTENTFLSSDLSTTDYCTETTEPTEPTEPTAPTEPTEPTEYTERTEPTELTELHQEDKTESTISVDINISSSNQLFDTINEPWCECADDMDYTCIRDDLNDQLLKDLTETAENLTKLKEDGLKSIESSWKNKDIMKGWKKPPIKIKKVSTQEIQGEEEYESLEKDEKDEDETDQKDEEKDSEKTRRVRDSYNFPQRIFSLIGVDPKAYRKGTAQMRKTMLQEALKENYSKLVKRDPDGPATLPCPCTDSLQEKTNSYCSCKPGPCRVPSDFEIEDLKELTKNMPYTSGLECLKMMVEGLRKIRFKVSGVTETSNAIRDLLKTIQNRKLSEPCKCPLHQIDMDCIETQLQDEKYMKAMLWEKFEESLDEKYGKILGVTTLGKVKREKTQVDDEDFGQKEVKKVSYICLQCGKMDCKCNLKT